MAYEEMATELFTDGVRTLQVLQAATMYIALYLINRGPAQGSSLARWGPRPDPRSAAIEGSHGS